MGCGKDLCFPGICADPSRGGGMMVRIRHRVALGYSYTALPLSHCRGDFTDPKYVPSWSPELALGLRRPGGRYETFQPLWAIVEACWVGEGRGESSLVLPQAMLGTWALSQNSHPSAPGLPTVPENLETQLCMRSLSISK